MDKAPYESARVKFLLYGLFMPMPSNDQSMAHSLGDINDHMLRLQRLRMILWSIFRAKAHSPGYNNFTRYYVSPDLQKNS